MIVRVDCRWRVFCAHDVTLHSAAERIWREMCDLEQFLTHDPLHARVRFDHCGGAMRDTGDASGTTGTRSPLGRRLVIAHRLMGLGPDRTGRVCRWREGRSIAVSDLSKRGRDVGFPHICRYDLEPLGPDQCRLRFVVRGRWTARFVPRPLVRAWLWWVMAATAARVGTHFGRTLMSGRAFRSGT